MKKRICALIAPLIALILECLPNGAILRFAVVSSEEGMSALVKTYSYFSLTPFGYANFGPLLTAILTCVLLLTLVLACVVRKAIVLNIAGVVCAVSIVTSLMPLMFGFSYFSLIGGAISLLLVLETVYLWVVFCHSPRKTGVCEKKTDSL